MHYNKESKRLIAIASAPDPKFVCASCGHEQDTDPKCDACGEIVLTFKAIELNYSSHWKKHFQSKGIEHVDR